MYMYQRYQLETTGRFYSAATSMRELRASGERVGVAMARTCAQSLYRLYIYASIISVNYIRSSTSAAGTELDAIIWSVLSSRTG
jgi:hypothetical protein